MKLPAAPELHAQQVEELKAAWANFKVDDKGGARTRAVKDARLAVVVLLIKGVNTSKLLAECKIKGDPKRYFSLLASGMSITSALFDVAAVAPKNLPGLGAESWTYQGLKGWGAVLGGGASLIGARLDYEDAGKADAQGYDALAFLYQLKMVGGAVSGALTVVVGCTYAAGVIGRLTGRAVVAVTTETVTTAVGGVAAEVIGVRILGMTLGGWFTAGLFGLQVVIWIVTPNALEIWIDHSAFGKKRDSGGYRTAQEQEKKLKDTLVEMGLSQ